MSEDLDRKLPVTGVMGEAADFVTSNAGRLMTAVLPAGVVLCVIQYFLAEPGDEVGYWMEFGILALQAFPYAIIAIGVHRIAILGRDSVPAWGILTWSMRELRFVGWLLVVYAAMMGIILIPLLVLLISQSLPGGAQWTVGLLSSLALIAVYFASVYLFSRLSMLFPATAVDRKPSLQWSWSLTEGNGWRIFLATMFLPGLIFGLVGALIGLLFVRLDEAWANVLFQPIGIVGMVWAITILSLTYKFLMDAGSNENGGSERPER